MSESNEFYNVWAEVLAESWNDQVYRDAVESNPAKALSDKGISIPKGVIITVKPSAPASENASVLVLPFPDKPAHVETGGADVTMLAAGACCSSSAICCCCP